MVPSPRFVDDPVQARDNKKLCDEFDDLLALGFVVDISENYEDNVREAWEEQGRHVRFMALSDFGMLMFMPDDTERKPN